MTSTGLVSGSPERAQRLSELLARAGAASAVVTDLAELSRRSSTGADADLDFYVQLPVTIHPEGDNAVARVGSFLSTGLLARFSAVEKVLSRLRPGASVVLVSGNTPDEVSLPDDQRSRLALLHLLAHATRAELSSKKVRVKVVSPQRSDEEIVGFALGEADEHGHRVTWEAAAAYQDWRAEVMGLVGVDI